MKSLFSKSSKPEDKGTTAATQEQDFVVGDVITLPKDFVPNNPVPAADYLLK